MKKNADEIYFKAKICKNSQKLSAYWTNKWVIVIKIAKKFKSKLKKNGYSNQLVKKNCILVRYEDLVENTKEEMMKVMEFIGEDYMPEMINHSESMEKVTLAPNGKLTLFKYLTLKLRDTFYNHTLIRQAYLCKFLWTWSNCFFSTQIFFFGNQVKILNFNLISITGSSGHF